MMVALGEAEALLGGATYSTADTVRPALQIIKTKPISKIVSSCFLMSKGEENLIFADCAINVNPSSEELKDIAIDSANTARVFGIDPKVAFLSFSSKGSAKSEEVSKVSNAVELLTIQGADFEFDGELQFDAAFVPSVAATKAKDSKVAGKANVFVFPDLNAGNIGYKIAQRLGGFEAVGPILAGLNKPVNDLSRGATDEEIYLTSLITLIQTEC
jgi:phosphate acetyltransferase